MQRFRRPCRAELRQRHAGGERDEARREERLERLVDLDMDAEFIGKAALRRVHDEGVTRKQVGLIIDGEPFSGPNTSFWPVQHDGSTVGKVTSAIHSPRLDQNIALAMISVSAATLGTEVDVTTAYGSRRATVVERPFFDPKKSLAVAGDR